MAGSLVRLLSVAVLLGASVPHAADQPPTAPADAQSKAEADRASAMARDEISNWEFFAGEGAGTKFTPEPKPLLRWSNPGAGRVYGDVFIGAVGGRPEVIASLYKWFDPYTGFDAELHSLSASPVRLERDGKEVWNPQQPGVRMRDVPDAEAPAETPAARLRAMRLLARGFSGYLTDRRENKEGEQQILRLLPQPIHRYGDASTDLIDGALFSFVVGTDPEIILMLEARRGKDGPRWQYGLARMNADELWVKHLDETVWSVPALDPGERRDDPTAPYYLMSLPQPEADAAPRTEAGERGEEEVLGKVTVVTAYGIVEKGEVVSQTKEYIELQTARGKVRVKTEDIDEIAASDDGA